MSELATKCVWCCGQLENGNKTHKDHLQYCVYFVDKVSLKWLKEHVHPQDTFIACKGTAEQNREYCTKEDTRVRGPWEHGTMPRQGARQDLAGVASSVMAGTYKTFTEFAWSNPVLAVRYDRGFQTLFAVRPPPPRCVTKCIWLWGPPGIGKTTGWQRQGVSDGDYFQPTYEEISRTLNFAGYNQEPLVVIDEINEITLPRRWWLQFSEEVPVRLPVKAGMPVYWNSKLLVATSNFPPPGIRLEDAAWTRRWEVIHVESRDEVERFWLEWSVKITRPLLGITSGQSEQPSVPDRTEDATPV